MEPGFPAALKRAGSYSEERRFAAGQDGVFFGAGFLSGFLKKSQLPLEIVWHAKDGDSLLKGQTFMTAFAPDEKSFFGLKAAVEGISYLSGAASLARCYRESSCGCRSAGAASLDSPFPEWERKALRLGGARTEPLLPSKMISSEKDLEEALTGHTEIIALDGRGAGFSGIQKLIDQIPSGIQKGMYGHFLPKDLERLSALPLDVIWPKLLQGGFPRLKINLPAG